MPEIAVEAGQPPTGTPEGQPSQQPGTPGTPSTPAQAPAGTGSPTPFTYAEDRSKWIPPHRFNEVSRQTSAYKTELEQLRAVAAERERQVQALTGSRPVSEDAQKQALVLDTLKSLNPNLARLLDLPENEFQEVLDGRSALRQSKFEQERAREQHTTRLVQAVAGRVAEAYGLETLAPEQVTDLRSSFREWVIGKANQELRVSDGERSETMDRFEAGEDKLLEEFVDGYTKRWIDPARRQVTAQNTGRNRPVPQTGGRQPVTTKRPEEFKTLEDRINFASDMLLERVPGYFRNR